MTQWGESRVNIACLTVFSSLAINPRGNLLMWSAAVGSARAVGCMWTAMHAAWGSLPHGEGSAQRQARSPMHGWLHREQRCGVKTKDYRKLSIILASPKPSCATFVFSITGKRRFHAIVYVWTGRKTDKTQKKTSSHGRIQELLAAVGVSGCSPRDVF